MLLYGKFPLIDTIQPNNIVIHTTAWDLWRNSTWLSTDYEIHSLVQYGESGWGIVSHQWKGCSMISSMGSCPSGFLFERETIIIALKYFGVSLSLPLSLSLSPLSLSLSLSLSLPSHMHSHRTPSTQVKARSTEILGRRCCCMHLKGEAILCTLHIPQARACSVS